MQHCPLEEIGFETFEAVVQMIEGKWKLRLLFVLASNGTLRYNEIRRHMPAISHKMLSSQLKELSADGFVVRTSYNEMPPRVEYRLAEKGLALKPIMQQLCLWIAEYPH